MRPRFDDVYFPHALVMDMFRRVLEMTPGPALGVIPDVTAYVASRRTVIAAALRGERAAGDPVDLSEAQLREFEKDELAFVILSVDIKGSTKLQTSTDVQTFAATINALLTEIAELVALFYGHVLKYTGDGLIALLRAADVHHQERRRARLRLLRAAARLRRDQPRA